MSESDHVGSAAERRRKRRLNFTDRSILALKPTAKLTDYWDSSLPGSATDRDYATSRRRKRSAPQIEVTISTDLPHINGGGQFYSPE